MQTHLGLHVIQITDAKPARQIPLEEAQAAILEALQNMKRQVKAGKIDRELSGAR